MIDLLEALTPSRMDHPRTDVIGRKASAGHYRQVVFARFFGETPSTSSGTGPGKLVERDGLEPSTPA